MCLGDNSTLVCEDLHESAGNSVTVKIFAGFVSSISHNSAYWFLRPLPINFAYLRSQLWVKGAQSQFAHFEKYSLNFSNSSFAIRVNLRHPWPSLFLYGLLLSLWCFPILINYYFQVSFHLKEILYVAKKTDKTPWLSSFEFVTNQIQAIEQYFHVVLIYTLHKMGLTF